MDQSYFHLFQQIVTGMRFQIQALSKIAQHVTPKTYPEKRMTAATLHTLEAITEQLRLSAHYMEQIQNAREATNADNGN